MIIVYACRVVWESYKPFAGIQVVLWIGFLWPMPSCSRVWKPDQPFAGIQVFSWCGILTATSAYACRVVRKSDQPFAGVQVILRSDILMKMNAYVCRVVRKSDQPFGGIQLIVCGDFLQLPPVSKDKNARFCFQVRVKVNLSPLSKMGGREREREMANLARVKSGLCGMIFRRQSLPWLQFSSSQFNPTAPAGIRTCDLSWIWHSTHWANPGPQSQT